MLLGEEPSIYEIKQIVNSYDNIHVSKLKCYCDKVCLSSLFPILWDQSVRYFLAHTIFGIYILPINVFSHLVGSIFEKTNPTLLKFI